MMDIKTKIEREIIYQPLKFGDINSKIKNILLIDQDVFQNEIFF